MKKVFFLFCAVIALIACDDQNAPSSGNASCSFTYKVDGLTVVFKNTSKGMSHYRWEFGDGHSLSDTNPTWTYEMSGSYKVTLKGFTESNQEYSQTQTITVKNNKAEYIVSGYKLYNIPYKNKYYLWYCEGMRLDGEEVFFFNTVCTPKLTSSDLPYTYKFVHPALLDDIQLYSYLTITVQYCATQDGDGTQCLRQKLYISDILKKKSEYILTSDNGKTKIGILMEYR